MDQKVSMEIEKDVECQGPFSKSICPSFIETNYIIVQIEIEQTTAYTFWLQQNLLAPQRPDSKPDFPSCRGLSLHYMKNCWLVMLTKTNSYGSVMVWVSIQHIFSPPPPLPHCGKSGPSDVGLAQVDLM